MKEDYLWDKTGSDHSIEELENSLRAFRLEQNSPRMIAPEVVPIAKPKFFAWWQFGFAAAAACLAIALIWSFVTIGSADVERASVPDRTQPTIAGPASVAVPVQPVTPVPVSTNDTRPPSKKKARRTVATSPAKSKAVEPTFPQLTEEEIYAYNRLVLALSITGDKLNLVRDKIKGE